MNGLRLIVEQWKMRLNLNGDVGIGTITPYSKLRKSDNGLTISGTPTTGERTAVLRLGSPYIANHDAYCAKITSTNNHDNNYNSDLNFILLMVIMHNNRRMTITHGGNVVSVLLVQVQIRYKTEVEMHLKMNLQIHRDQLYVYSTKY